MHSREELLLTYIAAIGCQNVKTKLCSIILFIGMRIKLYILIFPAHQKISMMYKFYLSNSRTPTYPQSTKIILKFACVQLQSLKRQIIILHCICNSRVFKRIFNNCCCTIFSHNTELHGQRPYSLGPSDKGGPQVCTLGTSFIKMLRELAFTGGLGPIQ